MTTPTHDRQVIVPQPQHNHQPQITAHPVMVVNTPYTNYQQPPPPGTVATTPHPGVTLVTLPPQQTVALTPVHLVPTPHNHNHNHHHHQQQQHQQNHQHHQQPQPQQNYYQQPMVYTNSYIQHPQNYYQQQIQQQQQQQQQLQQQQHNLELYYRQQQQHNYQQQQQQHYQYYSQQQQLPNRQILPTIPETSEEIPSNNNSSVGDDEPDDNINIIINTSNPTDQITSPGIYKYDLELQSEINDLVRKSIHPVSNKLITVLCQNRLLTIETTTPISSRLSALLWYMPHSYIATLPTYFLTLNQYLKELQEKCAVSNTGTYYDGETSLNETIGVFAATYHKTTTNIQSTTTPQNNRNRGPGARQNVNLYRYYDFTLLIVRNGQIVNYAIHAYRSNISDLIAEYQPTKIFYNSNPGDALDIFLHYEYQPFYHAMYGKMKMLKLDLLNNWYYTNFCDRLNILCSFCQALKYFTTMIIMNKQPTIDQTLYHHRLPQPSMITNQPQQRFTPATAPTSTNRPRNLKYTINGYNPRLNSHQINKNKNIAVVPHFPRPQHQQQQQNQLASVPTVVMNKIPSMVVIPNGNTTINRKPANTTTNMVHQPKLHKKRLTLTRTPTKRRFS